jgi:hypothetical protein
VTWWLELLPEDFGAQARSLADAHVREHGFPVQYVPRMIDWLVGNDISVIGADLWWEGSDGSHHSGHDSWAAKLDGSEAWPAFLDRVRSELEGAIQRFASTTSSEEPLVVLTCFKRADWELAKAKRGA